MMRVVVLAVLVPTLVGFTANAGDFNSASLLQVSNGPVGNTLSLDQSGASRSSLVGGELGDRPASQIGSGNSADVTVSGNGGLVVLNQDNASFANTGIGNEAIAFVLGYGGGATIEQLGTANFSEIEIVSSDPLLPATGSIEQVGIGNTARLLVEGLNVQGRILQEGNNNSNLMEVRGQNASINFEQIGDGLQAGGGGVQVYSNSDVSVTITQMGF